MRSVWRECRGVPSSHKIPIMLTCTFKNSWWRKCLKCFSIRGLSHKDTWSYKKILSIIHARIKPKLHLIYLEFRRGLRCRWTLTKVMTSNETPVNSMRHLMIRAMRLKSGKKLPRKGSIRCAHCKRRGWRSILRSRWATYDLILKVKKLKIKLSQTTSL